MKLLSVMVTEMWSYFQSQLDRARKIKVHIIKPDSGGRSYCGLQSNDDAADMSWRDFIDLGVDACSKCRHWVTL